jgi:hypothetical protein
LVVDISSSYEDNPIPDTSQDAKFVKRLFDDLNCGFLRSPGDGKIIILRDSDEEEEEEVHEEDVTAVEAAPSSAMKSPIPTTSVGNTDDANKGRSPDRVIGDSSSDGDEAGSP